MPPWLVRGRYGRAVDTLFPGRCWSRRCSFFYLSPLPPPLTYARLFFSFFSFPLWSVGRAARPRSVPPLWSFDNSADRLVLFFFADEYLQLFLSSPLSPSGGIVSLPCLFLGQYRCGTFSFLFRFIAFFWTVLSALVCWPFSFFFCDPVCCFCPRSPSASQRDAFDMHPFPGAFFFPLHSPLSLWISPCVFLLAFFSSPVFRRPFPWSFSLLFFLWPSGAMWPVRRFILFFIFCLCLLFCFFPSFLVFSPRLFLKTAGPVGLCFPGGHHS